MNKILFLILVLFLLFKLSKLILTKNNKATYQKAGERWEEIVKELSERK
tara:strand:+ start:251 stop:397 length:147 start_codon:yes stop_codon:yes gene_type:complete